MPACRPTSVTVLIHPPIHGDMVDVDAPLGQQLRDIAVGQAVTQVPANRDSDHLTREAIPGRGSGDRPFVDHPGRVPPSRKRSTQQCRSRAERFISGRLL
jgi:hypothetical protein